MGPLGTGPPACAGFAAAGCTLMPWSGFAASDWQHVLEECVALQPHVVVKGAGGARRAGSLPPCAAPAPGSGGSQAPGRPVRVQGSMQLALAVALPSHATARLRQHARRPPLQTSHPIRRRWGHTASAPLHCPRCRSRPLFEGAPPCTQTHPTPIFITPPS